MKPRLVLLDANVIIEAFRIGVWDRLVARVEVIVARSVFEDESVHWFVPATGERKYIDLARYASEKKVRVVDGSIASYAGIRKRLPRSLALHTGELESLAWLTESDEPACFCTADRAAVRAAVFLDLSERLVSLEVLLEDHAVARSAGGKLRPQFLERLLKDWRTQAQIEKLQAGH